MTTQRTRRRISRGLRKTYRDNPQVREQARQNAALASEKARELYILGQNAAIIERDNRELRVQVQVLTEKVKAAEAMHAYQGRRIRQLETEAVGYWELYQAALGPIEGREVSQ